MLLTASVVQLRWTPNLSNMRTYILQRNIWGLLNKVPSSRQRAQFLLAQICQWGKCNQLVTSNTLYPYLLLIYMIKDGRVYHVQLAFQTHLWCLPGPFRSWLNSCCQTRHKLSKKQMSLPWCLCLWMLLTIKLDLSSPWTSAHEVEKSVSPHHNSAGSSYLNILWFTSLFTKHSDGCFYWKSRMYII